jgi:hypothetical protein
MTNKQDRRVRIKHRVRNKISGTAERPRMSVFRSDSRFMYKSLMMKVDVHLPQPPLWVWIKCQRKNKLQRWVKRLPK